MLELYQSALVEVVNELVSMWLLKKKRVVFAVLEWERRNCPPVSSVSLRCKQSPHQIHKPVAESRCLHTSLSVSKWSSSRAGLGNGCFLQVRPAVGNWGCVREQGVQFTAWLLCNEFPRVKCCSELSEIFQGIFLHGRSVLNSDNAPWQLWQRSLTWHQGRH